MDKEFFADKVAFQTMNYPTASGRGIHPKALNTYAASGGVLDPLWNKIYISSQIDWLKFEASIILSLRKAKAKAKARQSKLKGWDRLASQKNLESLLFLSRPQPTRSVVGGNSNSYRCARISWKACPEYIEGSTSFTEGHWKNRRWSGKRPVFLWLWRHLHRELSFLHLPWPSYHKERLHGSVLAPQARVYALKYLFLRG